MINFEKLIQLSGHSSAVYALENGLEKNTFYSGSGDQLIVQWSLETLAAGVVIAKTSAIIYSLKLLAAQQLLLAGTSTGALHIIDLKTRKELRLLQYHQQGIFDIQVSEKNNLLVLVSGDGLISFCKLDDFSLMKQMQLCNHKLRSVTFNPSEKIIAVGCGDGTIAFIDVASMKLLQQIPAHKTDWSCNIVTFINDSTLLSGGRDAILNVIDTLSYSITKAIPAHNYSIYDIQLSADKKYFATASRDKSIKIWNATTFNFVQKIEGIAAGGHLNSVNKILWSEFNNFIISGSDDRSIIVWQPVLMRNIE